MKLPEQVKIGYKTYQIRPQDRDDTDTDYNFGFANHNINLIRSRDYGDKVDCANTLLHEILHGCFHVGSLGLEHDEEERIVTVLTNQLIAAMQDSPDVFRWIMRNANG
ncbi:MAG: hypothetical protein GVY36_19800 [Verrucomicrobia bacterium]|nr:hypothetical protein [Verrucomicrobiota bacterium]